MLYAHSIFDCTVYLEPNFFFISISLYDTVIHTSIPSVSTKYVLLIKNISFVLEFLNYSFRNENIGNIIVLKSNSFHLLK